MPFCDSCGSENNIDSLYCWNCGTKINGNVAKANHIQEKSHSGMKTYAVIIAFFLVAVFLGNSFINLEGSFENPPLPIPNTCTLVITLESYHVLFSVDYKLYVDGKLVRQGNLPALHYVTFTMPFTFWGDSKSIVIYATATGGGFGQTSDSRNIVVQPNNVHNVNLLI